MAIEIKEHAEITEERWLNYCKGSKRTRWQGIDVYIVLQDGTKVFGADYWKKSITKKDMLKELKFAIKLPELDSEVMHEIIKVVKTCVEE